VKLHANKKTCTAGKLDREREVTNNYNIHNISTGIY
jgi:hypothetical protein